MKKLIKYLLDDHPEFEYDEIKIRNGEEVK